MKEIKNLRTKTLLLLVSVCLILGTGCGYTIVRSGSLGLPDGRKSESHPTKIGLECWPTGYIQQIEKDIDECLNED